MHTLRKPKGLQAQPCIWILVMVLFPCFVASDKLLPIPPLGFSFPSGNGKWGLE